MRPGSVFDADLNDRRIRRNRHIVSNLAKPEKVKRFDMRGFRPRPEWIGEMKRCGILAPDFDADRDPIDVYGTERAYWKSLQYHAPATDTP